MLSQLAAALATFYLFKFFRPVKRFGIFQYWAFSERARSQYERNIIISIVGPAGLKLCAPVKIEQNNAYCCISSLIQFELGWVTLKKFYSLIAKIFIIH